MNVRARIALDADVKLIQRMVTRMAPRQSNRGLESDLKRADRLGWVVLPDELLVSLLGGEDCRIHLINTVHQGIIIRIIGMS